MQGNNKYFDEGVSKPTEAAYIGAFLKRGQKPVLHSKNAGRELKDGKRTTNRIF